MSTRARIALAVQNGYQSVYLHQDGDPQEAGRILLSEYGPRKTPMLMALGDLSILGAEPGEKHDFDSPPAGVCTFYGRDRGEAECGALTHDSFNELVQCALGCDAEYLYLFLDGVWVWSHVSKWDVGTPFGLSDMEVLTPEVCAKPASPTEEQMATEEINLDTGDIRQVEPSGNSGDFDTGEVQQVAAPESIPDVPGTPIGEPMKFECAVTGAVLNDAVAVLEAPKAPPLRFLCERKTLLAAVKLVKGALPKREVRPILKNMKVSVNGKVELSATDLEVGICLTVGGAQIQTQGEGILATAALTRILTSATDETDISVEAGHDSCHVRGESMAFEMPGEDPALFPDVPKFEAVSYHEIDAAVLKDMIHRTLIAAAEGETARYAMTGVLWEFDGDKVRLVATDGRRLAMSDGVGRNVGEHSVHGLTRVSVTPAVVNEETGEVEKEEVSTEVPATALVPGKTMALLEKNLAGGGSVRVHFKANEVFFQTEDAVIYSRLVEGRFPDYRQVFPMKQAVRITLGADALKAALKNVATMTDADSARVTFKFEAGNLTLQAQGCSTGRSTVEMRLDYDGPALDIVFNPKYLAQYLKLLPKKAQVEIALIDGATPALFKSGGGHSYLVMPLT